MPEDKSTPTTEPYEPTQPQNPEPAVASPPNLESPSQPSYDSPDVNMELSKLDAESTLPEPSQPNFNNGTATPADSSQPAPTALAFSQPAAKKSKKRRYIIIGSIIGLALLSGSGVAAYNLWYQNPDKVISDAVVNAVKAKSVKMNGDIVYENKDVKLTVTPIFESNESVARINFTLKTAAKTPDYKALDNLSLTADSVIERSGNVYFKLTNLRKTYDAVVGTYMETVEKSYKASGLTLDSAQKAEIRKQFDAYFGVLVDKLDNQWLKADTNSSSETSKSQKCYSEAYALLDKDENLNEVMKAFDKNRFVTVKESLGTKDGSLGYQLDFNEAKANSFSKAVESTKFGKKIESCDSTPSSTEDDTATEDSTADKTVMKVWVSQWSHEFTKLEVSNPDLGSNMGSFSMTFSPTFNQPVDIQAPKGAKSFDEISRDIESALEGVGADAASSGSSI
ncbi:MAG TPA: hypothetical protein PK096_03635 [Candidatus Saccharibacteria bacterium]|nr:hypothetical protein [Candidatus Saccharibacteria bacterium]HRK94435.1 hypothetical protein [Candidatus Saccharibacteria bacterium]